MTEEWLNFVVACRRGIEHGYDIVEGPMADDQVWDYVESYAAGTISKAAFWELVSRIPTPLEMGHVYMRLIRDTMRPDETYVEDILRVYNDSICNTIDNYNASAYYEPSYVISRAYREGGF